MLITRPGAPNFRQHDLLVYFHPGWKQSSVEQNTLFYRRYKSCEPALAIDRSQKKLYATAGSK